MSKPKNIGQKIIDLHKQGFSYNQIAQKLSCSKGSVCYHLGNGQKEKSKIRDNQDRTKIRRKISHFIRIYETKNKEYQLASLCDKIRGFQKGDNTMKITPEDILSKFQDNPVCYLTGEPIDLYKTNSYEFDHIIPKSRGGDNSIDNLQICLKKANRAKHDLTPAEFLYLCKQILENNGYQCNKL